MKLYYSPGACSLAPHILLRETNSAHELINVDLATAKTEDGDDFTRINPTGYVPALTLDNGDVLTEAAVMLQYIADQNPTSQLVPPCGTPARYHQMEMLNFIATEVHKTLGGLFNPKITPEWRAGLIELFEIRGKVLDARLAQHPYLMGEDFTAADAYLFTVLGWTSVQKVDITHPQLRDYVARIAARPSVVQAMQAEGLIE